VRWLKVRLAHIEISTAAIVSQVTTGVRFVFVIFNYLSCKFDRPLFVPVHLSKGAATYSSGSIGIKLEKFLLFTLAKSDLKDPARRESSAALPPSASPVPAI
jgi:hypothetical protein